MLKFYSLLLGFFLVGIFTMSAQLPNRFLLFNVKSGLSQNSVTCFFEDRKGLMWIGTQDGLNSFDGKTFNHFVCDPNDSNTLSNKYILKIEDDMYGNLWVGTSFGLNRLNPRTGKVDRIFVNQEKEVGLSMSVYEQFLFDKKHNLMVLHGGHFFTVNTQSLRVTQLAGAPISKLVESNNKKQHYLIRNDSLFDFKTNSFVFNLKPKLLTNQLIKIACNEHYMLFYTERIKPTIHIYHLKLNRWLDSILLPSKAFDIKILNNHTINVALNNGFVSYKNLIKESLINFEPTNPQSIPSGPILSSFVDSKHNLWLGSASSGIAIQPKTFSNFSYIPSAHKNDATQDITKLGSEIIIATNTGVYGVESGSMRLIKSFGTDRVNAVLINDEFIYAAVEQKGLFQLNREGRVLKHFDKTNSALQTNQIFKLTKIGSDIGLCTEKYFYKLNLSNQINRIKIGKDSNKFSYILNCNTDEQGLIYLSTNHGIAILDQQGNTQQLIYSNSNSAILGKTIVSSVVPTKGNIVISTLDNGIFILKNNHVIRHYYRNKGLPNNVVYNMGITTDGDIWACTNAGIARCMQGDDQFVPISVSDGLPASYYSFGSMQCFDHFVLVGTDNGLFIGDNNQMQLSSQPIQPYIHQILVNGQVAQRIEKNIELDGYKKNIEINFGHETIFEDVVFAYQLNNQPWVVLPINQKRINFSDFPLGGNSLKIKGASNVAGLNTASVKAYAIFVRTPWYLQWWVIALGVLLAFTSIFYFIKNYFRRKNEQKILAYQNELNIQKERERISRDLHDNIGSYATALLSKIQQMKMKDSHNDINEMNELGNNIISNIRETIWIMQTKDIKLQDFSDKIKNYILKLNPIYPRIQMKVLDDIEHDVSISPTTTTHLFRIIQEAVNNCVKHAQASELCIKIESHSNIQISIQDNGIGYEQRNAGEHYGVANMKDRASEINFHFEISKISTGTLIELQSSK